MPSPFSLALLFLLRFRFLRRRRVDVVEYFRKAHGFLFLPRGHGVFPHFRLS